MFIASQLWQLAVLVLFIFAVVFPMRATHVISGVWTIFVVLITSATILSAGLFGGLVMWHVGKGVVVIWELEKVVRA
jgi:hypothetical protein